MEEKILNTRKNGMAMLLLTLLGYVASIALFIYSITLLNADRMLLGVPLLILSIAYWIAGIFLFCGLKVLKPQEALVLTLFGDYIGTLKGQGFYWVNPFCTAVNPAAGTRLSQSGDVNSKENSVAALFGFEVVFRWLCPIEKQSVTNTLSANSLRFAQIYFFAMCLFYKSFRYLERYICHFP